MKLADVGLAYKAHVGSEAEKREDPETGKEGADDPASPDEDTDSPDKEAGEDEENSYHKERHEERRKERRSQ